MSANAEKPAIHVKISESLPDQIYLPVLQGIEEESIPYRLEVSSINETVDEAYEASRASILSVGIAIGENEVVVHYKHLPVDKPLFAVRRVQTQTKELLRNLGVNAARLVKGVPFKKIG
ncbi:glycerol dehydratase reactivase beta/small subunit family protein [Bacillaceae bacterium Marseille-Q3522]|nr:glycerol dehydratase reactivase beta/small subunit family protein [Bacillaceae bacterium Marseille-Q3522]